MHGIKKFLISAAFAAAVCPAFSQSKTFYWDEPAGVSADNAYFPVVVSDKDSSYLFYETVEKSSDSTGKIWIYMQKKAAGSYDFSTPVKITSSAFDYSGDIPDIYSAAVSSNGVIAVSSLADDKTASVFVSSDGGATFSEHRLPEQKETVVGLRIFASSSGGFALFASLGSKQVYSSGTNGTYENYSFSLLFASSSDGVSWSNFKTWAPSADFSNPFVPYLYPVTGGDLVVFQASLEYETPEGNTRYSNQLYA
ncbi:MAG: hypothetical protein J6Y93_02255, partial [Treponema sp.]|nr:hypothetical protein [Treponema sp.]